MNDSAKILHEYTGDLDDLLLRAQAVVKTMSNLETRRRTGVDSLISAIHVMQDQVRSMQSQIEQDRQATDLEKERNERLSREIDALNKQFSTLQEEHSALAEKHHRMVSVFDMFVSSVSQRTEQVQEQDREIEAALAVIGASARYGEVFKDDEPEPQDNSPAKVEAHQAPHRELPSSDAVFEAVSKSVLEMPSVADEAQPERSEPLERLEDADTGPSGSRKIPEFLRARQQDVSELDDEDQGVDRAASGFSRLFARGRTAQ